MSNYVVLSLETHLFFARIMKEHALFLMAGFPGINADWIQRADHFREQFEDILRETVGISNRRVGRQILNSQELTTEYTMPAEKKTKELSGIPIDSEITERTGRLQPMVQSRLDREFVGAVYNINQRALKLLKDFIDFKQSIVDEVRRGNLFTTNYPLLIEHILREAKLYQMTVKELLENRELSYKNLKKTEVFWNQIMMEHALFIRGLLDPCEEKLIQTADQFSMDFRKLLEKAKQQDCRALEMVQKTLEKTMEYRDFKAAGANGILNHKIDSIILPLLADHVLREANHYIRLLEMADSH